MLTLQIFLQFPSVADGLTLKW